MSGIFGIFNRNGRSVDKKIVDTMLEAMSYWKPDERGTWVDGPVALGHTMLWNTPESKLEHLPNRKKSQIITMDARLDNREELAEKLEMTDSPIDQITDSDFILSAYEKWGEACPKYLLGDFAFAIWDEKKQQMFCARDHIGIKPFYYYVDDNKFIFSNEIKVILSHFDIKKVLNDDAMAHYLKFGLLSDLDMTFYKNIYKLHAATSITIMVDENKEDTYWKAEECPKIHYNSLDEYIDRAKELLEMAVNVRVRSIYPIASHLSGGIDSSSIAVLAARQLGKNGYKLTGFNWTPVLNEDTDMDYFEWGNSKKIASLEHIEHQAIDLSEEDIFELYQTVDITQGDSIAFWYEHQIQKYVNKKNIRVILSGTGGDEFISNNSYGYIAGFFWRGEFKRAYNALRVEGLRSRYPVLGFIKRFYQEVILPSMPDWLYRIYSGSYCRFNRILNYIKPSMKKSIKALGPNYKLLMSVGVRNNMLNALYDGLIQTRIESWNTSGVSHKIEYRYPLLDKRIVEFALGVPEEMFRQEGRSRFLFRQAIDGLLPDEMIWSNTKYEPKRVEKYMEISQKAQTKWMQYYSIKDKKNEYFKLNSIFHDIAEFSLKDSLSKSDYGTITAITNLILAIEAYKRYKKC
ncbi:asparagine synthase-related protein [Sulfurovum sp. XTW-4]|uniref:asparagine synthase (glutamine-hydrolyzing) n=1 Tax=Sulfurovum xiamenensis TaxID=3019066 RepID=A0ABT7QPK9_9BACT|nr:asparagine synthase-related protein [Sulfurovum xiamenensis]MDM5263035.1 asparagine synthase-related protein [Sulfurovum xiamenensis]